MMNTTHNDITAANDAWIARCGDLDTAIETENQFLSVDVRFLPACAVDVLDGGEPTVEYYGWLLKQAETDGPSW